MTEAKAAVNSLNLASVSVALAGADAQLHLFNGLVDETDSLCPVAAFVAFRLE